ncbi:MAG: SDR family oxidoreductase [Clostridiales bacterium]|nr:SDR family oxidoreductase [Clostridiales bacterium]
MKFDYSGRVALITGAGGGIGRAIAVRLAQNGIRLVLCGRTEAKLVETAKLACSVPCHIVTGDLCDPTFPAKCIQAAISAFGQLDILINNAGLAQSQPFEAITPDEYDRIMNTNVKAPFLMCQAALPYLRASDCAAILNIASVTAHKGYPLQSIYSASKHALIGMSKSLANEVYKDGIRVHVISPGGVFTDMVRISRPDLSEEGMILPEDVAEVAAFFLENRTNAVIDEIQMHRVGKEPFA